MKIKYPASMNPNARTPIPDWMMILLLESFNGKRAFFDFIEFSEKSFFEANIAGGFFTYAYEFLLEIKQQTVLQQKKQLSAVNIFFILK